MTPNEFGRGELTDDDQRLVDLAKEIAADPIAARDKIRVPENAGEYAADFEDILGRIPRGYFRAIDCGRGWYPLIVETHKKLLALDPAYAVLQIKEKFGGLRYYHSFETEGADYKAGWEIEAEAERQSFKICEVCGTSEGVTTGGIGWTTSRCPTCRQKPNQFGSF